MPRAKADIELSPECLQRCNPDLKAAILQVLDSVSTRSLGALSVSGLQTYADSVRDYELKDTFSKIRTTNRLDTLAVGLSQLSDAGVLLALAYILKGRELKDAVRLAAVQSNTPLSKPIEDEAELDSEPEPTANATLLQDHGFTDAEYARFRANGALAG